MKNAKTILPHTASRWPSLQTLSSFYLHTSDFTYGRLQKYRLTEKGRKRKLEG